MVILDKIAEVFDTCQLVDLVSKQLLECGGYHIDEKLSVEMVEYEYRGFLNR